MYLSKTFNNIKIRNILSVVILFSSVNAFSKIYDEETYNDSLYKTKGSYAQIQEQYSYYKLAASLNVGYSYLSKRNYDIYYSRDSILDLGEDEIHMQKAYQDPTFGASLGIITPISENQYIRYVFLGVKALHFQGTADGEIELLKRKELRLKDSKAKLPLKSLIVMLNSKIYFHYEESGVRPFIELGVGVNRYELDLKVTGNAALIDTKLKTNKKSARYIFEL